MNSLSCRKIHWRKLSDFEANKAEKREEYQ